MKKGLLMFALLLFAVFFGNFLGGIAAEAPGLEWLGKEYSIGFSTFDIDLHVLTLTLGMHLEVNICEMFLILVSLLSYNKLAKLIIG